MVEPQLPKDSTHGDGDDLPHVPPPLPAYATANGHEGVIASSGEQDVSRMTPSETQANENVIILLPPAPARDASSDASEETADPTMTDAPDFTGVLPELPPQRKPASLMEISPIFSALDGTDSTVRIARPQPLTPPLIDAFELGILIPPRQPAADPADDVVSDFGETALQPLPDDPLAETESDASPEPEPLDEDVPPETAEKIAAEANATAAALEALKQLLVEKLPALEAAAARQAQHNAHSAGARQFYPPAHAPVKPPAMLPAHVAAASVPYAEVEEPPRRTFAMVGSFLAGFSLSWVVGAVLYLYLTTA